MFRNAIVVFEQISNPINDKVGAVYCLVFSSDKLDFKSKADQACLAGEEFHKLYYETFDKRRSKLSKLYLDTASLVWNGNACNGIAEIAKLFEQLPSSDFKVDTLDCQPIIEEATGSHTSILVNISGNVKFQDSKVHIFHQNFILTIQGDVWKIASDCLRFQE